MAVGTYKNEVVEEFVNEFLDSYVDFEGMVTVNNDLQNEPGDSIKVYTYTLSGTAEDVNEGYGNSGDISIAGAYDTYTVAMTQARTTITDEETYRNPLLPEEKFKGLAKAIYNKETAETIAEWNKCTEIVELGTGEDEYDRLLAAENKIQTALDGEANGPYWCVCTNDWFYTLKKALAKRNVLVDYDMINGRKFPVVAGIPIKVSSAMDDLEKTVGSGESAKDYDIHAFLADKTAVRLFRGKSVSVESDRTANTRTTQYFARDNYVLALEHADRVVAIGDEQD